MSSVRDAIYAITAVVYDPDVELSFEDKELLIDTNGMLLDYVESGVLD